jgi:hypothetical protein
MNTQELHLVSQIASLFWRLQRQERFEARMFDCEGYSQAAGDNPDCDPESFERGIAQSLLDNPDLLDKLSRYETRLRNQYLKTIRDLRSIQKDRLPSRSIRESLQYQAERQVAASAAPAPTPEPIAAEPETHIATATCEQNGFESQNIETASNVIEMPSHRTGSEPLPASLRDRRTPTNSSEPFSEVS